MKINYRVESTPKKKPVTLEGVRKVSDVIRNTPERRPNSVNNSGKKTTKKATKAQLIILGILGFLLTLPLGYVAKYEPILYIIAFIRNPNFQATKTVYKTFKVSYDGTVPETVKKGVDEKILAITLDSTKRFEKVSEAADVTLSYTSKPTDKDVVLQKDYLIPVGHLYWVRDTVSKGNILQDGVYIEEAKADAYKPVITEYIGKESIVKTTGNLLESLRTQEKTTGFISLNDLNATYKVLTLENKLFFENPTEGAIPYYLVIRGESAIAKSILFYQLSAVVENDFDPNKLLTVRMTGVTAITRSLGIKTNASKDPAYAARKIGDFLSKADLTHVSNEISFVPGCSPSGGVSFCTVPDHIAALKNSGVDIVELTGNHNNDKGSAYNTSTINTYKALGWDYFGGGLDSTDAAKILYKDMKGTKVAFLGYNFYDTILGTGAIASKTRAGANSWSHEKIVTNVAEARKNGADVVIVDFQYQECWSYTDNGSTVQSCYSPIASPNQTADFRQAVDAGADIVIGAQAHQPQTYEIYKGKNIFYGLGNLYFDQTQQLGTRQGLILTHYFYNGRYLSTALTTTLYDNDLLTYVTTGATRSDFLTTLSKARK